MDDDDHLVLSTEIGCCISVAFAQHTYLQQLPLDFCDGFQNFLVQQAIAHVLIGHVLVATAPNPNTNNIYMNSFWFFTFTPLCVSTVYSVLTRVL